ncbi:MAG: GNAT family N-acetyltransferase [Anaerolineae bacterium]
MTCAAASVRIETPRLILRTVTRADLDDVAESWDLDGGPISREEARRRIAWMLDNHARLAAGTLRHLCLAIVDRESRGIIGWCGLDHRDPARPHPLLFYLLKAPYWGQGLATEAAAAVLDYAFRDLRLAQVDAATAFDNLASKRVMEKIGMTYLGLDEDGGHAFTINHQDYVLPRK